MNSTQNNDPRKLTELSVTELVSIISETVNNIFEEKQLLERDRILGRCPYCHGEQVLFDHFDKSIIPCVCVFRSSFEVGIV